MKKTLIKLKDGFYIEPMEIITNENGTALRFPNGFQICYKTMTVTGGGTPWGTTGDNSTRIWYSDHNMGNWAVPFKQLDAVFTAVNTGQYWTGIGTWNNTSAGSVRCFRPNGNTMEVLIQVFGYGWWRKPFIKEEN